MSSKKQQDASFELIKTAVEQKSIGINEILNLTEIDYPLFSFRYLKEESYTDTKDYKFLSGVITRFHRLSEFGWENIRASHKHSLGMESIPKDEITSELPSIVTPDVKKVHLLRASGDNRAMIGLQEGKIFHVFFIAANYDDFYTHGNKK